MMKTAVQTVRLTTPTTPNPKRLSRTSSSSLSTIHRLSCAPDDSAFLSLALSPTMLTPSGQSKKTSVVQTEDHLYEEISSSRPPAFNGNITRATPQPASVIASDPPKLAPVSGVLHNKGPTLIRPIAFKPYVRSPIDGGAASLTSPKTPLSHTSSASIVLNNQSASFPDHRRVTDKHEANPTNRKPTGRSLSDPWKGSGHRKPIAPIAGDYSAKSRSTPSSIREDSLQMVYYPSSSDKSSYGYVSCSDQSAESLYGAHKTYHARMIRPGDEDEQYSFDPYQITSTPSPSDSGIAINYEALLREKDNEILTLRNTMELNEDVIFKVHEEKETSWKKQHDALKEFYETQLQKQSHENLSRQNELTQTIEQLRQHNLKLHQQFQSAIECKSAMQTSVEELERKCEEAEARLEEAQWTINEKTDQICLLKKNRSLTGDRDGDSLCQQVVQLQNKLETAQKEALQRNAELKDLRQTLNFLSQELFQVQKKFDSTKEELDQRRENAANRSKRASLLIGTSELSLFNDSGETERLRKDLMELRSKYGGEKRAMEEERAAWFEEKEKVIKYQKQLQLNYLEIYKRNCSLETELDDINASLRINDVDQDRPDSVRESDC